MCRPSATLVDAELLRQGDTNLASVCLLSVHPSNGHHYRKESVNIDRLREQSADRSFDYFMILRPLTSFRMTNCPFRNRKRTDLSFYLFHLLPPFYRAHRSFRNVSLSLCLSIALSLFLLFLFLTLLPCHFLSLHLTMYPFFLFLSLISFFRLLFSSAFALAQFPPSASGYLLCSHPSQTPLINFIQAVFDSDTH